MPTTATTYALQINLDTNGQISIEQNGQPAEDLEVQPGDTLQFSSSLPWAVQFIGEGLPASSQRQQPPVSPMSTRGGANGIGTIAVLDNAQQGLQWDYVVSVLGADNVTIYTKDPDIVIGNR